MVEDQPAVPRPGRDPALRRERGLLGGGPLRRRRLPTRARPHEHTEAAAEGETKGGGLLC